MYGGSSKRKDIERFNHQFPSILVATPGRLKDHLASTNGFIDAVKNLKILVLDETDRLLDMGFRRDIQDILSCLPTSRQTLLFSATLPLNVQGVVKLANKPDYKLVDCIQDEDPATQTNVQTEQSHIVLPTHRFWTGSMEVLLDLMDGGQSKIMVFFPMTSLVELYANLFNLRFGRRVWELHGKMHQKERSVTSRRFRNASSGVLFTSDVSARGVDYPNVTHVVQIGASDSRETYIHRLGRTGRAGKHGKGLLILPQLEQDFLQDLEGLDISEDKDLQYRLSIGASKELLDELGPVAQDVRAGRDKRVEKSVQNAYQAMVSYYFHRTEDDMEGEYVSTVNRLVQDMGLTELPAIDLNRARKIGIDDTPGLNIQQSWRDQSWTGSWGQGTVDTDRKEFGKPHGDFGGKFDTPEVKGTQFDRRNRWNQSDESNSSNDDRAGRRGWARPVSSRNPGRTQGFRRERHEHSVEKHSGGRRVKNQKSEKKSKAGYAKDPFGDFGKSFSKKKASSFQRWESHGSLSWP